MSNLAEAKKRIKECIKTQNSILNLTSCGITDLNELPGLFECTHLIRLHLRKNQISDISILKNLKGLQSLELDYNNISDISVLKNLKGLRSLTLSKNNISDISVLENLKELQALGLSENNISDISVLENLKGLQNLYLSGCQISDISVLENLKELQRLYLIYNQISDISVLKNLTKLTDLNLRNNLIKEIQLSIFQLDMRIDVEQGSWEGLCLAGNPIESPPLEIVKQGKQAVLNWFAATKEKLNEIKIILIGDSETGKTSLLRRLKDDSFDKAEKQTDGINIVDINFGQSDTFENQKSFYKSIDGENKYFHEITGHFWDFGGQEIMSATHALFLTQRTVYVLVLDARNDENITGQVRKWLKRIVATGGDSPIIVLANKIDINPCFAFLNQTDLEKEFPQIKDRFIKISCDTKENLDTFKNTLAEVILEKINTKIDVRWIKIKEKLQEETKSEKYLDQSRFIQICIEAKLTDKKEQGDAIKFLNDLGLILHFKKLRLTNFFVLDPYWITYGTYRILTSKIVADSDGKVCMNMLDEIVNKEEKKTKPYKADCREITEYLDNEMEYLIDILHEFKLCYRVEDHFIIPDLLNGTPPQHIIDTIKLPSSNNKSIQFVYKYDYLPDFIMPRIMAEMHKNTENIWRTGCVLYDNENKAIVTEYDDIISIIVTGNNEMWKFMSYIRHEIELINKNLTRKPKRLIPLPGLEDVFADYDELLIYIKSGESKYPKVINKKLYSFPIEELLYGIHGDDVKKLLQDLKRDTEEIKGSIKDIKELLNSHYDFLMSLPGNAEIKDDIQETIVEMQKMTKQQTDEIMNWLNMAFISLEDVLDDEFIRIYENLKQADDDVQLKLKVAAPLISYFGIDFEAELDIKVISLAKKIYEKLGLKIFKLIGHL